MLHKNESETRILSRIFQILISCPKNFFSKILSKYKFFKNVTRNETKRNEIFKFIEIKYKTKRKNLFVYVYRSNFIRSRLHEHKLKLTRVLLNNEETVQ